MIIVVVTVIMLQVLIRRLNKEKWSFKPGDSEPPMDLMKSV